MEYTLYIDESGEVHNATVGVGALRVLGGVLLPGDRDAHESLRGELASAFEGIRCDWHACELRRLRLSRDPLPRWILDELEANGTSPDAFRRGAGGAGGLISVLQGGLRRRVGEVIARAGGGLGATLVCFEHDHVGAQSRRDAMLSSLIEHAAWIVGSAPAADHSTLHVCIEAKSPEEGEVLFAEASIAGAGALTLELGGAGVRAGNCRYFSPRGSTGSKRDGPPGLVLADFVAHSFGPGHAGGREYTLGEAKAMDAGQLHRRANQRLGLHRSSRLLACGSGHTATHLSALFRQRQPPALSMAQRYHADVKASWDHATPPLWRLP